MTQMTKTLPRSNAVAMQIEFKTDPVLVFRPSYLVHTARPVFGAPTQHPMPPPPNVGRARPHGSSLSRRFIALHFRQPTFQIT